MEDSEQHLPYRATGDVVVLKPCPFCGGEAEILQTAGHTFCVRCSDCDTSGGHYFTEEDAAAAWNHRVAVTDEQFAYAVHDGRTWRVVNDADE